MKNPLRLCSEASYTRPFDWVISIKRIKKREMKKTKIWSRGSPFRSELRELPEDRECARFCTDANDRRTVEETRPNGLMLTQIQCFSCAQSKHMFSLRIHMIFVESVMVNSQYTSFE